MNYNEFLKSKVRKVNYHGFDIDKKEINDTLFDFQKDIVRWAIKKGKCAIFAMTGLGKTFMQLEWARIINERTKKPVLILTPLAVSYQTKREGKKLNIDVTICKTQSDIKNINVTNYEKLHNFDCSEFVAIVLDESGILKNYSGKTRNEIINSFKDTKYKLACTATPAPNDYMELGNHSEFLDVMKRKEMLSMFFVHDGSDTAKWRVKGHAQDDFWQWLCSWGVMLRNPSDLGYEDNGFKLPDLNIIEHIVKADYKIDNSIFVTEARTLNERRQAKRNTINDKIIEIKKIINGGTWIVWCYLNKESELITKAIDGTEIKGSDKNEYKEQMMEGFTNGTIKKLITKPKIAGHGMNWQHCNNVVYFGLDDSFEQYFQSVRRCWRYGQKKPVNVHIVLSDIEGSIRKNIQRKENDFNKMMENMVKHMSIYTKKELQENKTNGVKEMEIKKEQTDRFEIYNNDCVDVMKTFKENSIDYSITSPPFAELYTYSNNIRDFGNAKNYDEFFEHFKFFTKEIYRIIKPGRLFSLHCIDIPMMKEKDGIIGLYDFPGDLISVLKKEGFIYHSRVTIWKDPLIEVTRTKAIGLAHRQIVKDSTMCRSGLPDYLITVRKPGNNENYVKHEKGFQYDRYIGDNAPRQKGIKRSHNIWQKYASPVWMDINQSNTLQKLSAREEKDEKHICPLQLDVIERCITLYTNENEVVFDPFIGIGSVGYSALRMKRKAIGCELKESYFKQAVANLRKAEHYKEENTLFDNYSNIKNSDAFTELDL